MIKIYYIVVLVLLMMLGSCAPTQLAIDPTKNYMLTIGIQMDKKNYPSMTTLPKQNNYSFKFIADQKINFFSFKSCSTEIVKIDPRVGLDHKEYELTYTPNAIEDAGNCPIVVSSYNKDGMMSQGFISIQDSDKTLPAQLICGGSTTLPIGTSVCTEHVGSIEQISFPVDVLTSPTTACALESGNSGKTFQFHIKEGWCTYVFVEKNAPNRIHLLTVFGYDLMQVSI